MYSPIFSLFFCQFIPEFSASHGLYSDGIYIHTCVDVGFIRFHSVRSTSKKVRGRLLSFFQYNLIYNHIRFEF